MIQYDTYKQSGLDWLTHIPSQWDCKRIKDLTIINSTSLSSQTNPYYEFRYIDIGNVNQQGIQDVPELLQFLEAPSRARRILKKNDIIISTVRTYLRAVAYIDFDATDFIASTGFAVLSPLDKAYPKYLSFYFQSDFLIDLIGKYSKGVSYPAIKASEISFLPILFPPKEEQIIIANFLTNKTITTDKKIVNLEKKIEFYRELRKAIINDTVTLGLNKNAELKSTDTDINVPINWVQYRLKDIGNLYSGLSGKSGDDFDARDNVNNKPFIPFTNIAANTYIANDNLGSVIIEPTENQNRVKKGDMFFLMSSEGYEDIGKSSVLNLDLGETYLNSFCKGFRLKNKSNDTRFINYLLLSDTYRQLLIIEGKGFTRINLKMEKVNDFFVYLPPTKEEQSKIAGFLDEKTSKIDAIINNIIEQIEKLQELRKTLINDVVTGKIKVI